MFLLLNKEMKFVTNDSKGEFLDRIRCHTEHSKSKGFLFTTTDDYPISSKFLDDRVIIKNRYARPSFRIIVKVSSGRPTEISVQVVPHVLIIIMPFIIATTFSVVLAPLFIKTLVPLFFIVAFLILSYIVTLIAYSLHVWWTSNLFKTKLLSSNKAVHQF